MDLIPKDLQTSFKQISVEARTGLNNYQMLQILTSVFGVEFDKESTPEQLWDLCRFKSRLALPAWGEFYVAKTKFNIRHEVFRTSNAGLLLQAIQQVESPVDLTAYGLAFDEKLKGKKSPHIVILYADKEVLIRQLSRMSRPMGVSLNWNKFLERYVMAVQLTSFVV
jgi:hypothetical protein